MCGVISPVSRALPPAVRRWRVLCVLGLLAGLLGMHGLAPGGGTPHRQHTPQARVSQTHMSQTPMQQSPDSQASMSQAPMSAASMSAVHSEAVTSGHTSERSEARDGCGQGGHCGGGHLQHADATCASGAVGGGPVVPAPVADPVPGCVAEDAVPAHAAVEPEGGRAPPDLAELQLLRI